MVKTVDLTESQRGIADTYMGPGGDLGLRVQRIFAPAEGSVYDTLAWDNYDVDIKDDKGNVIFTQEGAEFPTSWNPNARTAVTSRYFWGEHGTPEREQSAGQLISRVANKLYEFGGDQGYFSSLDDLVAFRDDIAMLTAHQRMAFNSPVWFNVGIDSYTGVTGSSGKHSFVIDPNGEVVPLPDGHEYSHPQTSACFIQGLEDTMESIMQLATNEAMLFKYGSGTGTDMSQLRSSREKLSGGGKPSGPMAYLQFWDRVAGIVKSGGKTRRAAKMNSLRVDHPDIMEFIEAKPTELAKAWKLIDQGVDPDEALGTIAYQNANISVRATDDFMRAAEEGLDAGDNWTTVPVHNQEMAGDMPNYNAGTMLKKIAEGTHLCGDPGMQFHDTINAWHTCPNTDEIRASNPCSEYMFLDDSACNLASLNLLTFYDAESGRFDEGSFSDASRLTAIAQDLVIDGSSYPTEEIAKNAHRYRPLGQGYANLGALLMQMGLPYDSDEGRAAAAVITALQTGIVYRTSTEMAEQVGTFEGFDANRDPMLGVMEMHRDALQSLDVTKLPPGLMPAYEAALETWDTVVDRGGQYGFRNAQATVLAPTGTIGFMMGCDTLGIEPDFALVKKKRLSEGGMIPIINESVEPALRQLGYDSDVIGRIMGHLDEHGTVEGSEISDDHLAVFDCSNRNGDGERFIDYMGHLKMMGAVQPFLSGAISKTVNLPSDATVEDIEGVYMDAWRMGLKAVALYRDGSNPLQPLSSGKQQGGLEDITTGGPPQPARRKLPQSRLSITHKFAIGLDGHEGYLTTGLYETGDPGEIFIEMNKEGSTIGGLLDSFATSISIGLQHGVPLEGFINKFRNQRFEPRGLVVNEPHMGAFEEGVEPIHTATSIVDYVFNYLETHQERFREAARAVYGNGESGANDRASEKAVGEEPRMPTKLSGTELGGPCPECGTIMEVKGHCNEVCPDCHTVSMNGCGG